MFTETGCWVGTSPHVYDRELSAGLVAFFQDEAPESVVDLGCGHGKYVRHLRENGITCEGYDGNPDTVEMSGGLCGVLDLSEPHEFPTPFEWVLSLEVGEHLPPEYEAEFLANFLANSHPGTANFPTNCLAICR